jgi:alkyl hydroperoxide reductase subunit AhpC
MAASSDSMDDARKMKEEDKLSYIVGGELNAREVSEKVGAFFEAERNHAQPADFIVDPKGKIVSATYSTGPIGRLTASDTLGLIVYLMNK